MLVTMTPSVLLLPISIVEQFQNLPLSREKSEVYTFNAVRQLLQGGLLNLGQHCIPYVPCPIQRGLSAPCVPLIMFNAIM